jgi:hypothetical protein
LSRFRSSADLGPASHQVEKRAVTDIESPAHPQIGKRVELWASHQSGDGAFVCNREGQSGSGKIGRHSRSVPQHKADIESQALARVREELFESSKPS